MKKILTLAGAAVLMAAVPGSANAQSANLANTMKITTPMRGINEVPHGDMHGSGRATVTLYPKAGKVCYSMTVKGLMGKSLYAHIHKGNVGKAGGVVITLVPPGMNGRSVGCTKATMMLIRAIMQSPRSYYVNVHTKEYPGGAVRGQL